MYYGVEQSTDQRCPRTVIKKFTGKRALLKWMEKSGGLTYADPVGARNYHHTFRYGYELSGRVDRKDAIFQDRGSNSYPRNDADNMASYLYWYADKVNENEL